MLENKIDNLIQDSVNMILRYQGRIQELERIILELQRTIHEPEQKQDNQVPKDDPVDHKEAAKDLCDFVEKNYPEVSGNEDPPPAA